MTDKWYNSDFGEKIGIGLGFGAFLAGLGVCILLGYNGYKTKFSPDNPEVIRAKAEAEAVRKGFRFNEKDTLGDKTAEKFYETPEGRAYLEVRS